MKYRIFLLLCSLAILVLLSACNENLTHSSKSKFNAISEEIELEAKITTNEFQVNNKTETNYSINANILLHQDKDADRIVYEVAINEPRIEMNDIVISFSLDPTLFENFTTYSLFTSSGGNDRAIDIDPNGPSKGASHSRAYIIDKNKIDSNYKDNYKSIYTKISYSNNGVRTFKFLKIQGVASSELEKYIFK